MSKVEEKQFDPKSFMRKQTSLVFDTLPEEESDDSFRLSQIQT